MPGLCIGKDTDELFNAPDVQQVTHRLCSGALLPPMTCCAIYTANSWRNGCVFVPNLMQQGPEATQFSEPKINAVVRFLGEPRCSLPRPSICGREVVKEMFGGQLMGNNNERHS